MGTDPVGSLTTKTTKSTWAAGAAGGLTGGIAMGIILHAGSNMMPFIGALYGWPTVTGGWTAHLINSIGIGLIFAFIATRPVLRNQTTTLTGTVILGLIYATAVGLVTGGIMLPVATTAIGTTTLPAPILPLPGTLGGILVIISVGIAHLIYGLLLGATYGTLHPTTQT